MRDTGDYRTLLGALAVTALALAPACRNTAEGVKEDSKDTANRIGEEARELGGKVAEGARDVGEKIGEKIEEGVKEVGSEVGAKKQTVDVKAALMVHKSIDASQIDVATDADTKTVTLKGTVPTDVEKAAAAKVAREKAEGYEVRNLLTVVKK